MCFPSKKQNNNFTEDTNKEKVPTSTEKGGNAKPTKGQPVSTASTSASPLPTAPQILLPPLTTQTQPNMTTPKVAIIIYTMYGHIAKSSLRCSSHIVVHTHDIDIQLLRQRKQVSKVQVEKLISISTSSFH